MKAKDSRMHRSGILAAGALSLAVLTGCDVTNPGPVQDEFLALPASQQGLINGAVRAMSELVGRGAYTNALVGREIFPGGQTGSNGHDVTVQGGHILPGSFEGYWNDAVQARFIAETAIKRFSAVGAPDEMMYQAHLWAGYAYRTLGEWWCDAVIASTDPDDPEPGSYEQGTDSYFERAVENFTAALGFASTDEERYAALAGRAAANVWLGNWAAAAQDAAGIPDDFVFQIKMDALESAYYNAFYEAQSGVFRSYTIRFTFADDYYAETGDPRMTWTLDPEFETTTASLQGFEGGQVPYTRQLKFPERTTDMNLASGWEMRLIEAEAKLVAGDWQGAMQLINEVRTRNVSDLTGETLEPWVANSATEAWTYLKRERLIELWLEGRRLADERRWNEAGTPGSLDTPNFEQYSSLFSENPRSYCFDIPDSERDLNPNVPSVGG